MFSTMSCLTQKAVYKLYKSFETSKKSKTKDLFLTSVANFLEGNDPLGFYLPFLRFVKQSLSIVTECKLNFSFKMRPPPGTTSPNNLYKKWSASLKFFYHERNIEQLPFLQVQTHRLNKLCCPLFTSWTA